MLPARPHHCFPFPSAHTMTSHSITIHILSKLSTGFQLDSQETIATPYICTILKVVCPAMKSIALSVCSTKHLIKPLKVFFIFNSLWETKLSYHPLILTWMYVCSHLSKIFLHQKARLFDVPTLSCPSSCK